MAQGVKIVLSEKQEKWLVKHFKHTKNKEIAERLGIAEVSLHRIARRMGLTKSKQFVAKCQAEAMEKAATSNRLHKRYPPKGYIIPNSEQYRFRKGETSLQRLGKRREAERAAKAAATRRATWKSEKARAAFGLPQRTKLRVVPVPKAKINLRYYLKRLGYILDEQARVAYYTEDTKRGKRIEAKPQKWYKFMPMSNNEKQKEV